jgi:hypothetical protein
MDHLIAGERNPKVLAQLARAAARRKIAELEEALEGAEFFTAGHAARTTTSASGTCAARSPTTSASTDPSASKSPSAASPNRTQTEQVRRRPPDPYRPAGPDRPRWPGSAAARPANLRFSG